MMIYAIHTRPATSLGSALDTESFGASSDGPAYTSREAAINAAVEMARAYTSAPGRTFQSVRDERGGGSFYVTDGDHVVIVGALETTDGGSVKHTIHVREHEVR